MFSKEIVKVKHLYMFWHSFQEEVVYSQHLYLQLALVIMSVSAVVVSKDPFWGHCFLIADNIDISNFPCDVANLKLRYHVLHRFRMMMFATWAVLREIFELLYFSAVSCVRQMDAYESDKNSLAHLRPIYCYKKLWMIRLVLVAFSNTLYIVQILILTMRFLFCLEDQSSASVVFLNLQYSKCRFAIQR